MSTKEKFWVFYQQTYQRDWMSRPQITQSCMLTALGLIHDYLSNRKQRIKIENIYST